LELTAFSLEILVFLFFVAMLAGVLDTLAGGGGLLCIPALMLTGIPPLAVLGTNKLQGSMGTATATFLMFRNKKVSWPNTKNLMMAAFIGAAIGTIAVHFINTESLRLVIPLVLFSIAVYFLIAPRPNEISSQAAMSEGTYKNLVVPTIGFYDGMFGPGTGSFFALAGVSCRGHGIIASTAIAKPLNFATNFASLIVFLAAGHLVWSLGLLMMVGQAVGAWIGAHYLFRINPSYLRGIVVLMCLAMLIKYCHSLGWIPELSLGL
jgi:hypothetical protein